MGAGGSGVWPLPPAVVETAPRPGPRHPVPLTRDLLFGAPVSGSTPHPDLTRLHGGGVVLDSRAVRADRGAVFTSVSARFAVLLG